MGTLLAIFVIFLAFGLSNVRLEWAGKSYTVTLKIRCLNSTIIQGNTVYQKTYDWIGVPYLDAPPEGFGPDACEYGQRWATIEGPLIFDFVAFREVAGMAIIFNSMLPQNLLQYSFSHVIHRS